jgi:DNA repair protein RadC
MRSIVADIVHYETAAMVVAHNHPSGDPSPSESDLRLTRRLAHIAKELDCDVLDHLILTRNGRFTSFRMMGLL